MKSPVYMLMELVVGGTGGVLSSGFKSFVAQRKDKKEIQLDSREQRVEPGNLQDATFLNAVVKAFWMHLQAASDAYHFRFTAPILHLIIPFLGKSKDSIQAPEVLS